MEQPEYQGLTPKIERERPFLRHPLPENFDSWAGGEIASKKYKSDSNFFNNDFEEKKSGTLIVPLDKADRLALF